MTQLDTYERLNRRARGYGRSRLAPRDPYIASQCDYYHLTVKQLHAQGAAEMAAYGAQAPQWHRKAERELSRLSGRSRKLVEALAARDLGAPGVKIEPLPYIGAQRLRALRALNDAYTADQISEFDAKMWRNAL